jgi:hypothetical protein
LNFATPRIGALSRFRSKVGDYLLYRRMLQIMEVPSGASHLSLAAELSKPHLNT